jgi:DNA-binding response OmpR family regulator
MAGSQTVLLLDGLDVSMEAITERLRALRLQAVRAKTADEAFSLAEGQAIGAVILPSDLPGPDAHGVVAALRACATGQRLAFLAAGPAPRAESRRQFRDAGVALALFDPIDDARLRFQLNRALASADGQRPRGAVRVPCSAPARARTGNREKPGRLYTLSERGLFFETPRASMRGAPVEFEIQLEAEMVRADGEVAVSNVPGNLNNSRLPVGIGVRFTEISQRSAEVIRAAIAGITPALEV